MPVVRLAATLRLGALFGLAVLLAASGPAGAASDVLVPAQTPFGYNVGIDYETDVDGRTGRSITADLNQITQYFGLVRTYHDTANPNSATPIIDSNELQVIQYAMTHPAMNLVIGTYNSALVTGNTGNFCGVASGSFSAGLMDSSAYTDAWVQMLIGAFGGSTAAVQQSVKTILLGNEPDLPGTFMPGPGDPNYSNYVNTWIPNAIANLKTSLSNAGLGNIPISVTVAFSPVSDSIPCPGSNTVSKAIPQYIRSHWSASWNGGQPFVLYNQYSNSSPPTFNDITGYMQQVIGSLNGSNEAFVGETGVQSPGGNDAQEAAFYQGMFAFLGNEQQNYGRTLPVFVFQAFDLPAFNQTYGLFSQDANSQPTGLKPGIAITSFQLFTLSVSVSGGGTVTSNPAGINCGSTCNASFAPGTQVTLTATAASGWTFSGWSNACSGAGTCSVTMNSAQSVTATFVQLTYPLTVSLTGSGAVTSNPSGISCPSTCNASFNSGAQVTLTATPAQGRSFIGWTGACTGGCSVTMNAAASVSASFTSAPPPPVARTFVSAAGSDSNNCANVLTPCRHLAAAYAATAANGEIYALDPANYGSLTITGPVSIEGHGWASIAPVAGQAAITINANTGDKINIIGVVLDGTALASTTGIQFNSGGSLNIRDSVIRNFTQDGIAFASTSSSPSQLSVSNTRVSDNSANGIDIAPSGSGTVTGVLDHVDMDNNGANGLVASTAAPTINVTVNDSLSANNGAGISASSVGAAPVNIMVSNSTIANNASDGLVATSTGATIRVTQSTIAGNVAGWLNSSGGVVTSYADNNIDGNGGANTEPPSPLSYH